MSGKHAAQNPLFAPSVQGLEHGRQQARRRGTRRRVKNLIVSGVMFAIAGGVVGVAGYYLWQFYDDEQERTLTERNGVVDPRTAEELIDDFEDDPRFNGPGAPAFGIGNDRSEP